MKARARGVTLIELIIALGITIVTIALAMTLVVQNASVARKGEETANNNDAARFAQEVLTSALQAAGTGATNGLYVSNSGTIRQVNAIVGTNATGLNGSDELWVVTPHRRAMLQGCTGVVGPAELVQNDGTGGVLVRCKDSLDDPTIKVLMLTDMSTGALLSLGNTPFTASGSGYSITYAESGSTFSSGVGYCNAPTRGGFHAGKELVMPVKIQHFYIATANSVSGVTGAAGAVPGLYVSVGAVGTSTTGNPFVDVAGSVQLVQSGIEDMQLAFGVNALLNSDPKDVVFSNGLAPAYAGGLTSARVSVVARSQRTILDSDGQTMTGPGFAPMTVEDNAPAATADGRARTLLIRRIELPNFNPAAI